jgi:catechol 2,3-dioxygenase
MDNSNASLDPPSCPADVIIASVTLTVSNLETCTNYYTSSIGLHLRERGPDIAILGTQHRDLLILQEDKSASRHQPATGLYHVAFLLPSRLALGRQLRHFAANGIPMQGMSDHLVSEALYLADPEGNGIEIYRDREREDWNWEKGEVDMTTLPMEVQNVLGEGTEAEIGAPWEGIPAETIIGHIHLRVAELQQTEKFYRDILGLNVTTRSYPKALFFSRAGYHHHIGINIWNSANAPAPPEGSLGLHHFDFCTSSKAELNEIKSRASSAGVTTREEAGVTELSDPAGNRLRLR